jgi:CO dehydrogenase nickel-insertion accessory protein CooC1
LILNRLQGEMPATLQEKIEQLDFPLLGVIPASQELTSLEFSGRPVISLSDDSPVYQSVVEMMKKIF